MPPTHIQLSKLRIQTYFDDNIIPIDKYSILYEKTIDPESTVYKLTFQIRCGREYPTRFINRIKFQYAIQDRKGYKFITVFEKEFAVLMYNSMREVNISWNIYDDNVKKDIDMSTIEETKRRQYEFILKLKRKLINDCERLLSNA